MARIRREPIAWPAWRYGPDGSGAVFQSEAEVPYGWTQKPGEALTVIEEEVLDPETLAALLRAKGINPAGNWSAAYMKDLLEQ